MEDAPAGGLVYDENFNNSKKLQLTKYRPDQVLVSYECGQVGEILEIVAVADADIRDKKDEFVLSVTVGDKVVHQVASKTSEYEKQVVMLFKYTLEEADTVQVHVSYVTAYGYKHKDITFNEGSIQVLSLIHI